MKYWNKQPHVRCNCWTLLKTEFSTNMIYWVSNGYPLGDSHYIMHNNALLWCKQYPSAGKFYFCSKTSSWQFQQETDAMAFLLKWS